MAAGFSGGLTECPKKGSRTKFSKGHLHHQSSNWAWLTLNVEFEVCFFLPVLMVVLRR